MIARMYSRDRVYAFARLWQRASLFWVFLCVLTC
jgi:hypothetical protein